MRQSRIVEVSHPSPLERAEQDFAGAEITLIYIRDWGDGNKENVRSLVFAVVELLHDGLEFGPELPAKVGDACLRVQKTSEVNVRRVRFSVAEALQWYRRCAAGQCDLPSTTAEREQRRILPLHLPTFVEDPPWPYLVLDSGDSFWGDTPFWGNRPGGIRRHQLLTQTANFGMMEWSNQDRAKVRLWLQTVIPIDIFERPLLLGSAHLVLTNPVFGNLAVRLDKNKQNRIHVSLQQWPGHPLCNLRLHVREERPVGVTLLQDVSIDSAQVTLQLAFEPYLAIFAIISDVHGVLYASKPQTFVRQIKIDAHLQTGIRKVSVPSRSRKRNPETYSVPIAEVTNSSRVGIFSLPPALAILIEDKENFRQQQHALELGQRWFDGNVEEATKFVRDLIRSARKDIFIVDAYFGCTELVRYALATTDQDLQIKILTSQEYLLIKPDRDRPMTYGAMLVDAEHHVREQVPSTNIEIRVGRGNKAPVHDRFIVLDMKDVWLIGSSLNELGSRGTTVVRLPHGGPVRDALIDHWDVAILLDDFIQNINVTTEPEVE